MYEKTFPNKRFKLTLEFLNKHVTKDDTILDLGVPNPLTKIMIDDNDNNTDLSALEERVDELINTVNELKTENSSLKNQQENLVNERAVLIEKTEHARSRIEAMISRLRAMETRS